jgi:hypothetical protein
MATADRYWARAGVLLAMASKESDATVRAKLVDLAAVFLAFAELYANSGN